MNEIYEDLTNSKISAAEALKISQQSINFESLSFQKYILETSLIEPIVYDESIDYDPNIWTAHALIDLNQTVNKWPLIIKTILTNLESTNLSVRKDSAVLIRKLVQAEPERTKNLGFTKMFFDHLEPNLHFLPPLTSFTDTMMIFKPSLLTLACLSTTGTTTNSNTTKESNSKLNYLAREGALKCFLHTQENVKFTVYLLQTLTEFINDYLKELTIIHLHAIIQVFTTIMCDPFITADKSLNLAACEMLEAALAYGWPRVHSYKQTILYALIKANQLKTPILDMLQLSSDEIKFIEDLRNPL